MISPSRFKNWRRPPERTSSSCVRDQYPWSFHRPIISAERIMKHLAAINAVIETEAGEYARNGLSHTLAHTKYADSFPVLLVILILK